MTRSIRTARERDYARIVAVMDAWWGRRVSPMLPKFFFVHFTETTFVAEDPRDEIAGFSCGFRSPTLSEEAYVHFAGVVPAHRRSGLGRKLYETFFHAVLPRQVIRAVTSPSNEASIAFHRALGFRVDRLDDNFDGRGGRRVMFVRRL